VSPHRERLRPRILHALDELSHALSTAARYADAVEVAQASVACDRFENRDSARLSARIWRRETQRAARIRAVRVAARPRTRAAPERRTRDLGESLFRAVA
jgi:hypothetical protein